MSTTSSSGRQVRRRLATFTGRGYSKGAPAWKCALWVVFGQPLQASVLCPPQLRRALLRAFGADIAPGVLIRHGVRIHWPWKLSIGRDSWIGVEAWLLNLEPITIGADVCISQQAMLCTGSHRSSDTAFEFDNAPIVIEDGAWIATRATILRGVRVCEGALVGAGVVLSRDLPPGARALATEAHVR